MTLMNTVRLSAACAVLAAATAAAQSRSAVALDETPLTLTGCVVQGERPDSFLITNVKVGGAGAVSAPVGAYYRFDTVKGLKEHVNHQVEISGLADLADIDKGTVTTKTNSAGESTTSVNSERRTVTAKDTAVGAGTAGPGTSAKVAVNTYGFKVGVIRMVSNSCSDATPSAPR